MDEHLVNLLKFAVGVLVLASICALLFALFPCMKSEAGAAWVGAIGTVATLVGTIYLATDKDRREQRTAERKAYVIAAKIYASLETLAENLLRTSVAFESAIDVGLDASVAIWTTKEINDEYLTWKEVRIDSEDLTALSVLEGPHAFRLARALQIVQQLRETAASNLKWGGPNYDLSRHIMRYNRDEILSAFDHLTACKNFYRGIVEEHASDRSGEKISGHI